MNSIILQIYEEKLELIKKKYELRMISRDEAIRQKKELDVNNFEWMKQCEYKNSVMESQIDNIKKSAEMRIEIAKGIKEGKSDRELFLMACKSLELLIGEGVFYANYEQ